MTPAHSIRHRLAEERNRLEQELSYLKPGSSVHKIVRGKLLMAWWAIEVCDQELLAIEQGRTLSGFVPGNPPYMYVTGGLQ